MFLQEKRPSHFYQAANKPIDIVNLLEPVNYMEEKEKWFKSPGKSYNPRFIYNELNLRASLYLAKKLRHELRGITEKYATSSDWRSILTSQLLISQSRDLDATIPFLEAIVKGKIPSHELAQKTSDQLFGVPTKSELAVVAAIANGAGAKKAILDHLIGDSERSAYSRTKLERIVHTLCHDFEGILTPEEFETLSQKAVTPQQASEIAARVFDHIIKHVKSGEAHIQIEMYDNIDSFAIARNPFNQSRLVLEIPANKNVFSADYVLQCYAHEINSHLRNITSTYELIKDMPFHFQTNLIARTQRLLAQEGFATLNGESVIADSDSIFLDPLVYEVPTYAAEGHSFSEIVRYIYEYYDIDPDIDYFSLHNDVWGLAQVFNGLKDTSSHCGYTFPWRQVYLFGPLRTLRELCRKDDNYFEDPLSLMRYSELPFDIIRNINHIEYDLKQKLAPDPFEIWDYANPNPSVQDIPSLLKQLLLDL